MSSGRKSQLPVGNSADVQGYEPLAYAGWLGMKIEYGVLAPVIDIPNLSFVGNLVVLNVDQPLRIEPRSNRHKRYTQDPGTRVIFSDEMPSRVVTGGSSCLSIWIAPEFRKRISIDDPLLVDASPEPTDAVEDTDFQKIGQVLLAEMTAGFPSGRLFGQSLSTALVARLLRRAGVEQSIAPPRYGLSRGQLRQVLEYIDANFSENLTLTDLADVAGLSPYHFARLFKKSTGVAPHQYLLRVRVDRSKPLLADGRHTVAHIAQQVGFSSQGAFATHFRKLTGVNPGRFAR